MKIKDDNIRISKVKKYLVSQVFIAFILSFFLNLTTLAAINGRYDYTFDLGNERIYTIQAEYINGKVTSATSFASFEVDPFVPTSEEENIKKHNKLLVNMWRLAQGYSLSADNKFTEIEERLLNELVYRGYTIKKEWTEGIWLLDEQKRCDVIISQDVIGDKEYTYVDQGPYNKWETVYRERFKNLGTDSIINNPYGEIKIYKGTQKFEVFELLEDEMVVSLLGITSSGGIKVSRHDDTKSGNYSWEIDESTVTAENQHSVEIIINKDGAEEFRFLYDNPSQTTELLYDNINDGSNYKFGFLTTEVAENISDQTPQKLYDIKGENYTSNNAEIAKRYDKLMKGETISNKVYYAVCESGNYLNVLKCDYVYQSTFEYVGGINVCTPFKITDINRALDKILKEKNIVKTESASENKGGWKFTKRGEVIVAEEEGGNSRKLFIDISLDSGLYTVYAKDYRHFDLQARISIDDNSNYNDSFNQDAPLAAAIVTTDSYYNDSLDSSEYELKDKDRVLDKFLTYLSEQKKDKASVMLVCYYNDDKSKGLTPNNEIDIRRSSAINEEKYPYIFEYDITDMLIQLNEDEILEQEKINKDLDELLDSSKMQGLMGKEEAKKKMEEAKNAFYDKMMEYVKPLLMFIVFLTLLYGSLTVMLSSFDVSKRVILKEKLMHICMGVALVISATVIMAVAKGYMDANFAALSTLNDSTSASVYEMPDPDYKANWLVSLLISVIDGIAGMFCWIIEVTIGLLTTENIFDVGDAVFHIQDVTLSPFSEFEWARYMFGYACLASLVIGLLFVAVIKISYELIIFSGNAEKIVEAKQNILRLVVAILGIIIAPYGIRLLLLFFNSLMTMIPVEDTRLDITFSDAGIIGSVCNILFVFIKLKIYMILLVRKLMLAFMLLSAPFVFGVWAISNKFRSLNIWFGELFSNAATQLCYALMFFVVLLISFKGQNAFISLIMISMITKLADFFKDSIQGLMQKWGGINETGAAEGMVSQVKGISQKAGNIRRNAGNNLVKGAGILDKNSVTKGANRAHNIGSVMSGNIFNIRTERDRLGNLKGMARGDMNVAKGNYRFENTTVKATLEKMPQNSPERAYYARVMSGNASEEEMRKAAQMGGIYSSINNVYNAKKDYQDKEKTLNAVNALSPSKRHVLSRMQQFSEDQSKSDFVKEMQARKQAARGARNANNIANSSNGETGDYQGDYLGFVQSGFLSQEFADCFTDVCVNSAKLEVANEKNRKGLQDGEESIMTARKLISSCEKLAKSDELNDTNSSLVIDAALKHAEYSLDRQSKFSANSHDYKRIAELKARCEKNSNVSTRMVIDKNGNSSEDGFDYTAGSLGTSIEISKEEQLDDFNANRQNFVKNMQK